MLEKNRMDFVMSALNLSAAALSRASGVDASIINKWRKGSRALTGRSSAVSAVAAALVKLDGEQVLWNYYAPYRAADGDKAAAMTAWLVNEPGLGITGRTSPPQEPSSGEYKVEHMVFLGQSGFHRAAMAMLDYVRLLPPGQTITAMCFGRWEWFIRDIPFVILFITKLKAAMSQGTRLRMITRKGFSMADSSRFAGLWLSAHLKGYIRSSYYVGTLPRELRFVCSIPGYWSARVQEDPFVEDNLYVGMFTNPRETRRDAVLCGEWAAKSRPSSQYAFFSCPSGDRENQRLWRGEPLPLWEKRGAKVPDGSFHAFCRVPGIGIFTRAEAIGVAGADSFPVLPRYLLQADAGFCPGPHRIILCREDLHEGLMKERRMHEVASAILHRRAFVPQRVLRAQIQRLINAMEEREDFRVALIPRFVFQSIGPEMVCFRDSITVGWLQDMSESVFCNDEATAGSFYGYLEYVWNHLQKGWKRKETVSATLRKWLSGP